MSLERNFHRYFGAIERAGGVDRCWLCRRTPAAVKAFFGFHEDGHPIDAERYGIEDIVGDGCFLPEAGLAWAMAASHGHGMKLIVLLASDSTFPTLPTPSGRSMS